MTRRSSVWARPFSLAATRGFSVDSSSSGYLDVSVRRVWLPFRDDRIAPAGLPHSGIHGSLPACRSPWLLAACHALLRLWTPRHPPYAFPCLTLAFSPKAFSMLSCLNPKMPVKFAKFSSLLSFICISFSCVVFRVQGARPQDRTMHSRWLDLEYRLRFSLERR